MRGHAWCHAVFRVSNAKVSRGNTDFHKMWHVAFTRNRIMTFTRDVVVLTKLNNQQDSSCL